MKFLAPTVALLALPAAAAPIGYDSRPLGSIEEPLLLRTYVPDPGIDPAVFGQHDQGEPVAKYSPQSGRDVAGEDDPIAGVPAAIAVNFGPALSYVFDTTECRLLYAWQGGFLDLYPYWGEPRRGTRRSFDYVPRLVGTLIHQTAGAHPVELDGTSLSELGPRVFRGYTLRDGVPTFRFTAGDEALRLTVRPLDGETAFRVELESGSGKTLAFRGAEKSEGGFVVRGEPLGDFEGFVRRTRFAEASIDAGEEVFTNYGCIACHSLDGSAGHGPTLAGIAGSRRKIEGVAEPVLADRAYLIESVVDPNARVVEGFPPNYMPTFPLKPVEAESLALYIESIGLPE